ncbi:hypothetical protein N665_1154s0002 [Sinapis alba]|nr:hypothetical protein N665_1154s0002 [Sinapis alba]
MLPGNRIRNQSSGAKNRKRKARQDEVIKSQANDMLKYVTRTKSSKTGETSKTEEDKEDEEFVFEEDDEKKKADDIRSFREDVDMDDLGNWKKIEQRMRDYLVERGPPTRPPIGYPFPIDGIERCFTYSCYTRRMSNGEKQDRRWLVYSKSKDKLFCFCCKLFSQETYPPLLVTTVYDDWRNASHRLKNHETTYNHIVCMSRLIELEMRLKRSETIDKHLEEAINKEKKHWIDVMLRIIVVVKTLAERNLAFRGENEKVSDPNSGNFLVFIKMIGGFDEVMKEHIRRVDKELLANEIRMVILKKIQEAKSFSIILDTTPDISRKEQRTFLIRCVDVSTDSPKVEEFFLSFLEIKDKTGEGIFTTLQDALVDLKLNISDVRGQGYDNWAFYTPCGCHSLNLALCDMASSTEKAASFFGIVQRLYNLFSSSTNNWEVYREMVNAENSDNLGHHSDDECLAESETHGIGRFEFLFGMVIWYDLLYVVNIVSKSLQSEDMDLEAAILQLGELVGYLKGYRETGFEKAKAEAMQIAIDMEIEPAFSSKFEQFQRYEEIFGFLFGLKRLKSAKDDELMMSCVKLEASLEHDGHFDVDGKGKHMFMELQYLRGMLPKKITKAIQISFSKLKFIKNYLCSTMSQERLNGLLMISIENELAEKLDYSKLINDFAGIKARRVIFHE